MKLNNIKILLLLLLHPLSGRTQFYIGPGSIFYAAVGTPINFDSLTLIPDVPVTLSDLIIDKAYMPVTGTGGASVSRIYTINAPLTFSGTVGMYVANGELNSNVLSALQIAYDPGTGFITTNTSTVNEPAAYVSNYFSTPVTLSRVTAVRMGVILPLGLIDFDAFAQGSKVKLVWTTAGEQHTDRFIVEKSTDGKYFRELLTRKAEGGTTRTHYTGYDNQPAAGLNYYRLASRSKDGSKSYSAIKIVRFEGISARLSLSVYPNPVVDMVHAELLGDAPQQAWLTVTDISGKVLMKLSFDYQKISFSMGHLAAGIYFANYSDEKNSFSFKLNKL